MDEKYTTLLATKVTSQMLDELARENRRSKAQQLAFMVERDYRATFGNPVAVLLEPEQVQG